MQETVQETIYAWFVNYVLKLLEQICLRFFTCQFP